MVQRRRSPKSISQSSQRLTATNSDACAELAVLDNPVQGELPDNWQALRLGDLLHEVDVRARDLPEAERSTLEVLSLTKNHGLVLQSERFGKRIATEDISKYKVVRRNQIVYNPYVIWEGAVHALKKYPAGLVSPVYHVWETNSPDDGFIDYLLRTPPLIDAYNRVCSGAVNRRRSIREEAFKAIPVGVPPLPEQRAIAAVLHAVQDAKEASESVISATRRLKQSLLWFLFTYGPVPFDQADQVPMKETDGGPVPEHWNVLLLGDLAVKGIIWLRSGYPDGKFNEDGIGIPHLRPFNVSEDGSLVMSQVKWVLEPKSDDPHRLKPHDVIFNNTNSEELVGKTAYFDELGDFVLSNHMTIVRVNDDRAVDARWLASALHLKWQKGEYRTICRRHVNQASIGLDKLRALTLGIPPIQEQHEIAAQLSAVDAKLAAEESQRDALESLSRSLLHHLITGKMRVTT